MKNMFLVLHVLSLRYRDKTNLDFCLKHERDVLSSSEAELGQLKLRLGPIALLPGCGEEGGYGSETV